jgi:hypothetical protein
MAMGCPLLANLAAIRAVAHRHDDAEIIISGERFAVPS